MMLYQMLIVWGLMWFNGLCCGLLIWMLTDWPKRR